MNRMIHPAQFQNSAPKEALAGTVERVTFHNAENGFCVLKVQVRGKRDLTVVVGYSPIIGAGEWIAATGAWVSDRVHGLQFKADVLKATPPTGAEGIEIRNAESRRDRHLLASGQAGLPVAMRVGWRDVENGIGADASKTPSRHSGLYLLPGRGPRALMTRSHQSRSKTRYRVAMFLDGVQSPTASTAGCCEEMRLSAGGYGREVRGQAIMGCNFLVIHHADEVGPSLRGNTQIKQP